MDPASKRPALIDLINPATVAADAGSMKMPSSRASMRYARRISSSVTMSIQPRESFIASRAGPQDAGFPILMAVATVRGSSMMRFS